METETQTQTLAPALEQEPDCQSERLWTALSARWLGRCRETDTMEAEKS